MAEPAILPLDPVPAGIYAVRVYEMELSKSQVNSRQIYRTAMRVVYGVEKGRQVFTILAHDPAIVDSTKWKWELAVPDPDPIELNGEVWVVELSNVEYQGVVRTEVKKFYKLPEGMEFA